MVLMKFLFWLFVFLSIYSYAIYPVVIYVWSKLARRQWKQGQATPSVSIIISVYNEEDVIAAKIRNALALDYPDDLLEIIVSSDGSTDGTNDIVAAVEDPRVVLHSFERLGKTACLNKVVPMAKGQIVLFTDANAMFPSDTVRKMVRHFADDRVGLVTGGTRYFSADGDKKDVTGLYAGLESWTKHCESLIDACVGADGAIFAVRKDLFVPLKGNDINDFIIPLNVIEQGFRVILDREANCHEPAAAEEQKAFRRQVRITNRTMWAIMRNLQFCNPKRFGVFAFFLISHKLLRFGVPVFLMVSGAINLILAGEHGIYLLTLLGYIAFPVLGLLSYKQIIHHKIGDICKFFLLTIAAQLMGMLRMMVGIEDKIWTPER
jgi:glycosyltransferase involved in cell wall biosynthesis